MRLAGTPACRHAPADQEDRRARDLGTTVEPLDGGALILRRARAPASGSKGAPPNASKAAAVGCSVETAVAVCSVEKEEEEKEVEWLGLGRRRSVLFRRE